MKVFELISILQELDPNVEVVIPGKSVNNFDSACSIATSVSEVFVRRDRSSRKQDAQHSYYFSEYKENKDHLSGVLIHITN